MYRLHIDIGEIESIARPERAARLNDSRARGSARKRALIVDRRQIERAPRCVRPSGRGGEGRGRVSPSAGFRSVKHVDNARVA